MFIYLHLHVNDHKTNHESVTCTVTHLTSLELSFNHSLTHSTTIYSSSSNLGDLTKWCM